MFDGKKFTVLTGVSKSHLLRTSKLLYEQGSLRLAITSFIPSNPDLLRFYPKFLRRKFESRIENVIQIPRKSFLSSEIVYQIGRALEKLSLASLSDRIIALSFEMNSFFSNLVIKKLPNSNNEVLVVRAGFGKRIEFQSRIFVCDASLAHPQTMNHLIERGEFGLTHTTELSKVDTLILNDIQNSDVIVVNSDFVRESFIFAGVNPTKIVTSYLPPLPQFKHNFKRVEKTNGSLKLLFAGGLERRKGINLLYELVNLLNESRIDFELHLVGKWGNVDRKIKKKFLSWENVFWTNWVTELELSEKMQDADIFVFPSYAEGGARVVTEAMATGLPVITTWNSGSPITHGYDGIICGLDSHLIYNSVVELANNPQKMLEIGRNGQRTISNQISDVNYLSKLTIDFHK